MVLVSTVHPSSPAPSCSPSWQWCFLTHCCKRDLGYPTLVKNSDYPIRPSPQHPECCHPDELLSHTGCVSTFSNCLEQVSLSEVPEPAASVSPGSWLETQMLKVKNQQSKELTLFYQIDTLFCIWNAISSFCLTK